MTGAQTPAWEAALWFGAILLVVGCIIAGLVLATAIRFEAQDRLARRRALRAREAKRLAARQEREAVRELAPFPKRWAA